MRKLLMFILAFVSPLAAEDAKPCGPWELPATVILSDARVVRGLTASDLVATADKKALTLDDAAAVTGARRTLLVLETIGGEFDSSARKVAAATLPAVLDAARPEDSFALLALSRDNVSKLPFGADRKALLSAVQDWAAARKAPERRTIMPALREALSLFGNPKPGDAIIILGPDLEFEHSDYAQFMDMIVPRGVRVFTFLIGPIMGSTSVSILGIGSWGLESARASFYRMAWDSGGFARYAGGNWIHDLELNAETQAELQQKLWRMYVNVVDFYRVRVTLPAKARSETWKMKLSDAMQKKVPDARVLYPRWLPRCNPPQGTAVGR